MEAATSLYTVFREKAFWILQVSLPRPDVKNEPPVRVTVTVAVPPGTPPVLAYGGELNQVWVNLIDNALDAIAGGGRLDVSAGKEGGKVIVRIADDGPGIPEAVLPRIFDPFFTTKPVGQGTGLGLDIVRRLLNRHNGVIEVDSGPGRTVFTVTLPAASAQ